MDKDWLERDRMITEIHSDMKYLLKWSEEHDRNDDRRFETANKRIAFVEKIAYGGIGSLATLQIFLKFIN